MVNDATVDYRILEKFGADPVGYSGNEVIYRCPWCEERKGTPDLKGHLYVHNDTLLYFCQRCQAKGRIYDTPKGYTFEVTPSNPELVELLESIKKTNTIEFNYEIPNLFPVEGTPHHEYLRNRGITDRMIKRYNIRKGGVVSRYKDRIIIPNQVKYLPDGRAFTDMFVARYIYDIPKDNDGKDLIRRYLNPYGDNRRKTVFNLSTIKPNTPIIITEGCFTAIAAGVNAVCTYGKYVSDLQLFQILSKSPSKIYVNLDGDAYQTALELCERIKKISSIPLYVVRFDKKEGDHSDASSIGHNKYIEYLSKARLYDRNELYVMDLMNINHQYLNAFEK